MLISLCPIEMKCKSSCGWNRGKTRIVITLARVEFFPTERSGTCFIICFSGRASSEPALCDMATDRRVCLPHDDRIALRSGEMRQVEWSGTGGWWELYFNNCLCRLAKNRLDARWLFFPFIFVFTLNAIVFDLFTFDCCVYLSCSCAFHGAFYWRQIFAHGQT